MGPSEAASTDHPAGGEAAPAGVGPVAIYALGHSDAELDRLQRQARVFEPITRRFFLEAGIAEGMRVLDVGSGAGDVAFLAAALVGPRGEVIGTDTSATALATARRRAAESGLRNVTFLEGDPAEMAFDRPFDAVVGRYVLQFCPEPSQVLRKVATHLRSGGIIVFHELDWNGVGSYPAVPTYDRCCAWFVEMLRRVGTETQMGLKLYSAYVAAGLPPPSVRLEAVIGGAADNPDRLFVVADLVTTLLPTMERLGIATAAEVGVDTLAERLLDELAATGGVIVGRSEIAAWSRIRAMGP